MAFEVHNKWNKIWGKLMTNNTKPVVFNPKLIKELITKNKDELEKIFEEKQEAIAKYVKRIKDKTIEKYTEIDFQQGFFEEIFCNILGYTYLTDGEKWNVSREVKTEGNSTKADGGIGFGKSGDKVFEKICAVVELKDANYTDLDKKQNRVNDNRTPVEQAFGYVQGFESAKWVIVSNFKELRLYHQNANFKYEAFDLSKLEEFETFARLYFLLSKENFLSESGKSKTEELFENNISFEKDLSEKFYKEYKALRLHVFENLKAHHSEIDEKMILEKTQKLLDRFIFVCFCEDKGILENRIFRKTLKNLENMPKLPGMDFAVSKWQAIKGLFNAIDKGDVPNKINKFNGGLFAEDNLLDAFELSDEIIEEMAKITDWDFDTELNVNILGHIFEQSISDLEQIKAEIDGEDFDKKKGKRKKDGVFYTPEYITRYIVEQAVGGWLNERKKELGYFELPERSGTDLETTKNGTMRQTANNKRHLEFWEAYREVLTNIKILDPACGSGAFLNQAFDFLYNERERVNQEIHDLADESALFDVVKRNILTDNLYGVDLNPESVEISKLSLWIKTANRNDQLTSLDDNIKCGNSLIDDPSVAGDRAFDWETEFPEIMENGGFDVVIGNPPYVVLSPEILSKYELTKYNYNTYIAFLELAFSISSDISHFGYIIPNTWFAGDNYEIFRNEILGKKRLKQIIQLPYDIFRAYIDTSIIIMDKDSTKGSIIQTHSFKIKDKLSEINQINFDQIDSEEWEKFGKVFLNPQVIDIGDKVWFSKKNTKLENIASINRGTLPPKECEKENAVFNSDDCIEWFEGQIYRYVKTYGGRKSFVHYSKLRENKDRTLFIKEKLLARQLISRQFRMNISYTAGGQAFKKNLYAIFDLKEQYHFLYLLSVLNSALFSYCQVNFNASLQRDDFPAFSLKDFKNFPIPDISSEEQQPFTEKAEAMLLMNKELSKLKGDFFGYLRDTQSLAKVSQKLGKCEEMETAELMAELKKYKVNTDKKDVYDSCKAEHEAIRELKAKIDKTDAEIDRMVYALYGLTDEEIAVVEARG